MPFLNHQPIRRQILVATLLLIVPFAIGALWSANRTRLEHDAEEREQAGALAATAASYLNQYLNGVESVAAALALHPAVRALDRQGADPLLAAVIKEQPLIINILVTDLDGRIGGTGRPERPAQGDVVTQPYIRAVAESGKPMLSEILKGAVTGKPTVIFAYPVRTNDRVTAVIGIGLNLERFETLFNTVPLPEGSVVTLTNRNSVVLARNRDPERYIGTTVTPGRAAWPSDVPSTQVLTGVDGIERYYGNAVVDRGPWLLSVGIPTSVAFTRLAPIFRRNVTLSVLAMLAVLLLSLWSSKRLSEGLGTLRTAAQRIAGGDLSPPEQVAVPNLELAQLQDAFVTMAANLRKAHTALEHQMAQERKMREALQSLQRQVVRQERLAAVGVLVSGVAHELNNPLQAILGTIELLERQADLSPAARDEIAFVKTQSGRAREIIRNLSRFSAQQSGPPSLVDLGEVVQEAVQLRRRDLDNASISLEVDATSTRKVHANFTELEQVALNFVINAQQSIETAGRIAGRILIRVFDTGKKIRLEVHDDGPGVTPEDEPKLFQPFFTTKPVGKGTGLGLSVSYGIIESYGGSIGYAGNDWGGATFYFELPAAMVSQSDDRPPLLQRPVSPRV